MKKTKSKIKKNSGLLKFLIVLTIFAVYLLVSILNFGLSSGVLVAALSWSFFVFCTPIADAGFLLDFPIRILVGMRMLYTEIIVWVFAACLNIGALTFSSETYQKTALLSLFHQIITTPWPLGLIIALSAVGTYISVYLGDDAYDIAASKDKKGEYQKDKLKMTYSISAFIITIVLYALLLKYTHVHIKVF